MLVEPASEGPCPLAEPCLDLLAETRRDASGHHTLCRTIPPCPTCPSRVRCRARAAVPAAGQTSPCPRWRRIPRSSRRRACAGSTSNRHAAPTGTGWKSTSISTLDYEDVFSRNQRPKLDQYDDYVFIVLYFPLFDKDSGRILTAELDLFLGEDFDHDAEHPTAAAVGDVRALPREG